MGPVFYIAAFLGTIAGSGFASWKVAERYNRKHSTSQAVSIRRMGEILLRIEKEQDARANDILRIHQAIGQLREKYGQKFGNGTIWYDLLGGK